MKRDLPLKQLALAFVFAVAGYAAFYTGIEHLRVRKGPWEVTFALTTAGVPAILINQPRLHIRNVRIFFPGETVARTNTTPSPGATNPPMSTNLFFSRPRPVPYDLPFGNCLFMDTTFLPGTITFQLYGHEIELLPRVLIIDHEEHPWTPDASFSLSQPAPGVARPKVK